MTEQPEPAQETIECVCKHKPGWEISHVIEKLLDKKNIGKRARATDEGIDDAVAWVKKQSPSTNFRVVGFEIGDAKYVTWWILGIYDNTLAIHLQFDSTRYIFASEREDFANYSRLAEELRKARIWPITVHHDEKEDKYGLVFHTRTAKRETKSALITLINACEKIYKINQGKQYESTGHPSNRA